MISLQFSFLLRTSCAINAVILSALLADANLNGAAVKIERSADVVTIRKATGEHDASNQPFATYHLRPPEVSALKIPIESGDFFHPVTTPKGVVLTDLAPPDHPHHRGVFIGWVEMHGEEDADFWGWGEHAPTKGRRIVNREVVPAFNFFLARNVWWADARSLLTEELQAKADASETANVFDLTYTLTPISDITLSRWAFSGFCLRVRKEGEVAYYSPSGLATNKNPSHLKPETDWPDAPWYAASIKLSDGSRIGGAVINHPQNPPTLWHNHRDVRMINPCIVAPNEVKLEKGKLLILRYRVVTFDGEVPTAALNELAAMFRK